MRRTKIIATLGPASSSLDVVEHLVQAGMDAARVNFSHGSREEHALQIAVVRSASSRLGREVAVIQDLQGPKIRVGRIDGGAVDLVDGAEVTLVPDDGVPGSAAALPISLLDLAGQVAAGAGVLLDDGRLRLRVLGTEGARVRCLVVHGGRLTDHKGVNLPGVPLRVESLTPKDLEDLAFGAAQGVDYVALSFVRSAADVRGLRAELQRLGSRARIIAKIEKREALGTIDAIIAEADAVMVARGDLGVEIPAEEVPHWQKDIIRRCVVAARPVITATQMLESMISGPSPTRAEASDVANAVYDGTSAVMLSGETAVGAYPVEAVATMDRICCATEENLAAGPSGLQCAGVSVAAGAATRWGDAGRLPETTGAIASAACHLAHDLGAAAIITPTQTGSTARHVASFRPAALIAGAAADQTVRRQLALVWGVLPLAVDEAEDTDSTIASAVSAARAAGLVFPGDIAVVTCGARPNLPGSTNLIEVVRA
jgi:pyruvate kinase